MKTRDQHGWVEYHTILTRAGEEGWMAALLAAHSVPCTVEQAKGLFDTLCRANRYLGRVGLRFVPEGRGRAYYHAARGYRISLPATPLARSKGLRVGLVLHEFAHLVDRHEHGRFSHGPTFCQALRRLLPTGEPLMSVSSFCEIYARHRGPYVLLLTREKTVKGKTTQTSDRVDGTFSAAEAHEEARMLVNDPREDIVTVFVWSDRENAHIGAWYKRGETYRTWEEERREARMDVVVEQPEATLLPGGPESLQEVDALEHEGLHRAAAESGGPVPGVQPTPADPGQEPTRARRLPPTKLPGDRFPVVRGKALTLGREDGWPSSQPAQEVRTFFEGGRTATAAEVIQALGAKLHAMGMAHPSSLVSRLKQTGLLKEVA